jgi:hypothetical protein
VSAALIDPRPPPPKYATRPRTTPIRACEVCSKVFVPHKSNVNRFCSQPCWWKRIGHDPALIEAARRHWDEGVPTLQIAALLTTAFDRPVTKNAVIGLAHRHGFPARPSPINFHQQTERRCNQPQQ